MSKKNIAACKRRASELGIPHMFDPSDWEKRALEQTRDIIAWAEKHGKYPSEKDHRVLGYCLRRLQRAKIGKHRGAAWYPSCEKLAAELGHPDLFNHQSRWKLLALKKTRDFIAYHKEHGNFPKEKDGNTSKWLGRMRQLRKGTCKVRGKWHPECEELAIELGYPNMFKRQDLLAKAIENTEAVVEYCREHGRPPVGNKTGGYLGFWLSNASQAKRGIGQSIWYPECEERARELGYPDLFELKGKEVRALKRTRELARYYDETGSTKINDKDARTLANWLSKMKMAKAGKPIRTIWYPSCEELAAELGYPDMFLYKS